MVGRRLSDGAVVAEPASDQLRWIVSSVLLLVAAGSCPSHDSFTAYLGAMAQHPSDLLGGLSDADGPPSAMDRVSAAAWKRRMHG